MADERHDLGLLDHIKADALGEPGQRTFRLRLASGGGSALVWIEKEQLQALAMAIDQLLTQLASSNIGRVEPPETPPESGDFPSTLEVEMRAGRLGLGYDDERDLLVVLAHEPEANEDGPPNLTCRVSRGKMQALSSEIGKVVAAGRPRCPLCGAPVSPGAKHSCPGSNGHSAHSISGLGQ